MKAIISLVMLATGMLDSKPVRTTFIYCGAQSVSPRGAGLIITSVFRSRSDPQFVENVFTNYLGSSYAPYGNGWIFRERSPFCSSFDKKTDAEYQRRLDISRIPQPAQSIFNVTFVMQ